MKNRARLALFGLLLLSVAEAPPARGYITNPVTTLGQLARSTYVTVVRVEKVDKDKGIITYRKVQDLQGKYPRELITHAFDLKNTPAHKGAGDVPIRPDEKDWRYAINWAEPGKTAVVFALKYDPYGDFGHTYIDGCWYATMCPRRDWDFWYSIYSDPALLSRWHCGTPAQLVEAIEKVIAGKEAIVPVLVEGTRDDLRLRRGKLRGLKISFAIQDFNPKRDLVDGRDFERLPGYDQLFGMPGFTHYSSLPRVDPDAQAVSSLDIDGDGKPDLCLVGGGKVALFQNGAESMKQMALPGAPASRAAVWADYNGDGRPDLFLAALTGPRLYTNLGTYFQDDSHLLPAERCYNLTAAAWLDHDGDGRPDLLLGNGFHGLRLYRNAGSTGVDAKAPPAPGAARPITWKFEDISTAVGLGPNGLGSNGKGDTLSVADFDGDGRPDFLYGAGRGLLARNMPQGFVEQKDCGIAYQPGKVGPTIIDFDDDGKLDLFIPQNGACKLFKNDGTGKFADVTAQSGDLARPIPFATSAAWGDLDNDGKVDVVVGSLRGPNRCYRNLGGGKFSDETELVGLHLRYFSTQAVCLVDLNNDGVLDMIFNNEGQDSAILLGSPARVVASGRTPLTVQVAGSGGVIGSQVRLLDKNGRALASQPIGTGAGRGGQDALAARFAVPPGDYRLEVRYSSGVVRGKDIKVTADPLRGIIDDQTPKVN